MLNPRKNGKPCSRPGNFERPTQPDPPRPFGISCSKTAILILIAALALSLAAGACCPRPTPSLYPAFDILKPNDEVKKNPIIVNADGTMLINFSFWQWAAALKEEIITLRDELAREKRKK